jgi:N-acetylmuramidase-like protein
LEVSGLPTKADQPTDEGYAAAAWLLVAETRAMKAIATVEAGPEGAFLPTDEPVILFERHVFSRLTGGRYDAAAPTISNPKAGGYGTYAAQHARLALAVKYDREAALKSASWGLFQIMGENFRAAGFSDVQRFVSAMYRSADDHLRALVMFIRSNSHLVDALRAKDWRAFAFYYNGPGYAKSRYDERIAQAYVMLA